jgi:hypothetical protein
MRLAHEIIEVMKSCDKRIGDRDQRSALGIADSFVRGADINFSGIQVDENNVPQNRDSLAAVIIGLVEGKPKASQKEALQAARYDLNAPFRNDPAIVRFREERAANGITDKLNAA